MEQKVAADAVTLVVMMTREDAAVDATVVNKTTNLKSPLCKSAGGVFDFKKN